MTGTMKDKERVVAALEKLPPEALLKILMHLYPELNAVVGDGSKAVPKARDGKIVIEIETEGGRA
ncbi:MAG: hypothetical protein ABC588_08605 [Candidatus Methanosuratincola petrocarbonis]